MHPCTVGSNERSGIELLSCSFEEACDALEEDDKDDFDWMRISGRTPSFETGPEYDHTFNNKTGKCNLYFVLALQCIKKVHSIWKMD